MKDLSEPNITTYHYEYDTNGNRTLVEIKDDGLTLESTVYTYDRLNKLVSSREVTVSGLYIYEYTYDNGNLTKEDRHRSYELNTNQWTNIRIYEYTKDNKLESVYSGNTLLVSYTYDGDGTITSSLDRDLDLNQNLNINDNSYLNRLTANQRQLINKVSTNDSFLYELTEYITDKNRPYSETLMERDGTGQLSTVYTYGNQRINSESYNNLTGLYTYDGRGSVSAVIGSWGDFRASYWYDGLGNVKSQIHGYGAFGSGKKYYGYNAEQYNPVTGNQNLRARQVNIRRQRFLTEDTYIGLFTETLSINRYIYASDNPLRYNDPSGFISNIIITSASKAGPGIGCGGGSVNDLVYGFNNTELAIDPNNLLETFRTINNRIDVMIDWAIAQANFPAGFWERNYDNANRVDNDVIYNDWYWGVGTRGSIYAWCSVFVIYNGITAQLAEKDIAGNVVENATPVMPSYEIAKANNLQGVSNLQKWYSNQGRYFPSDNVTNGTYIPHKGDVFFVKDGSHTGIVVSYDSTNQIVNTIEGNTDPNNGYNGYAVMEKQRKLSKIKGFGYNMYTGDIIQ